MKTVLNKKNFDTLSNPLFLGQDLGLQRYDKLKYPKFYELYDQQLNNFWRPQEVTLLKDIGDYKNLTDAERFIFDSNLMFQTGGDSLLSRSIHEMANYVTNPELEICMNVWSFFETIHSNSYTYILQNVYPSPDKFFNGILDNKEIVKRLEAITSKYDALLNTKSNDPRQEIFEALIGTQIVEGLTFYVSFACSFYFGYRGKMEGNAKVIKAIARDEACLTDDAQVLTQSGWKKIIDLSENDTVCQYHKNGDIDFVKPSYIINKPFDGEVDNYKNDRGHLDMTVSKDHRVIYHHIPTNEIRECLSYEFKPNAFKRILLSGKLKSDSDKKFTPIDQFLIALQADGSMPDQELRNGRYTGCNTVMFNFTKDRKKIRFEEILKNTGFEYTKSEIDYKGRNSYYVKVPLNIKSTKRFSEWINYSELNLEWCEKFMEEVSLWDGHRTKDDFSDIYYSSVVEENAIVVQTISTLCGRRAHKGIQIDNRKESYSDVHRIRSIQDKNYIDCQTLTKTSARYKGQLVCVTVPTGMFLAKQNGKPFITGNCHVSITQNILKYLKENKSEGFQDIVKKNEDLVYEAYKVAVEAEKNWADYLFSKGNLVGLTADGLKSYIEWLANNRLTSMGYKKLYPNTKTNPLNGWLDSFYDSKKLQVAPQETEISSYTKGIDNSMPQNAFDGFKL